MKKSVYLSLAGLAIFFAACEKSNNTPVNPGIDNVTLSKSWSDTQVDSLINQYYVVRSVDITPDAAIVGLFREQFASARDVEWEMANNVYCVDFEIGNVDYDAWYDKNGQLLMYMYDIRVSALPEAIRTAVANQYSGYNIGNAEKVFKGTMIGYYIELKKRESKIDIFLKEDGTPVYEHKENGNTTPSKSWSDTQIDSLMNEYFAARSVNITPGAAIISLFKEQFANARDVEWEMANNVYCVDFEIGNVDYDAWYDKDGRLLVYKYDIWTSALPEVVKTAAAAKYPGYRIDGSEKVLKGSITGYYVELEKGESEVDAFFKDDGTFIIEYFDH